MAGATPPESSSSASDALSYYSFILLVAHLGCFFFFSSSSSSAPPTTDQPAPTTKQPSQLTRRKRISPISCAFPQRDPPEDSAKQGDKDRTRARSATALVPDFVLRCSIRHLFSFHRSHQAKPPQPSTRPAHDPSPQSPDLAPPGLPPLRTSIGAATPNNAISQSDNTEIATPKTGNAALATSTSSSSHSSFSTRGDVHPCATCGDVFPRPHLLDLHHSARHAFADLPETESGGGIVRIIFLSGWKPGTAGASPAVSRVLRIRNPARAMQRFEECRDAARARAAERKATGDGKDGDLERCVADGNERLRFVGATYVCAGLQGKREGEGLGTCGSGMCRVCGIVRHGFGGKGAATEEEGGVATYATGWAAHTALTLATEEAEAEAEDELTFLHARKAVIVCRVVAGRVRVGRPAVGNTDGEGNVDEDDFDSAVVSGSVGGGGCGPQDQLVVFNPRAVLPCFVILYSA